MCTHVEKFNQSLRTNLFKLAINMTQAATMFGPPLISKSSNHGIHVCVEIRSFCLLEFFDTRDVLHSEICIPEPHRGA